MTLPLTTTTVTIERLADGVDPYEAEVWSTAYTGVPAVISGSSGVGQNIGGAQQTLNGKLFVDGAINVKKADRVTDGISGEVWMVDWVRQRYELGLGHRVAGLTLVEGAVN